MRQSFRVKMVERGPAGGRGGMRRGMLLVMVLVLITVLTLVSVSFSFWMQADLEMVDGLGQRQQARLAAESGLTRVMLLLRDQRVDMDNWWNNREALRRILVWSPEKVGGSESLADQEVIEGQPAWRFSVVATEYEGDRPRMRYGLMDEAGKLNLNTATREQLLALFGALDLKEITPEQLADALMDWRDADDEVTGVNGAESSYYMTLEPAYRAKNKPLDTVEELLTVKYFNGRVLYGEDYNRNGYLDRNEDDGPEGVFPPDDGDGVLDQGLLPYVTVFSWDVNSANDNKPRININAYRFSSTDTLPEYLTEELSPDLIDFLAEAQKRKYKFRSVGELVGLEVYEDGSTNYDTAWKQYKSARKQANRVGKVETESEESEAENSEAGEGSGGGTDTGSDGGSDSKVKKGTGSDEKSPEGGGTTDNFEEEKDTGGLSGPEEKDRLRRRQAVREAEPEGEEEGARAGRRGGRGDSADGAEDGHEGRRRDRPGRRGGRADEAGGLPEGGPGGEGDRRPGGREGRGGRPGGDRRAGEGLPGSGSAGESQPEGEQPKEGEGGKGGEGGSGGTKTKGRGTPVVSPVTTAELDVLMDRLTVQPLPVLRGLINVNTAPPAVLRTIPGLTEEEVQAIASRRGQLGGEDKMTPAWLVTSGVLDATKFALISNLVTARSIQFSVDVIGFADHAGAMQRIQAVVEMQGQLAQVKYYRDLTPLGVGYPLDGEQQSEAFEFDHDR